MNTKAVVIGNRQAVIHQCVSEGVVGLLSLYQPIEHPARIEGEAAIRIHRNGGADSAQFRERDHADIVIGGNAIDVRISIVDHYAGSQDGEKNFLTGSIEIRRWDRIVVPARNGNTHNRIAGDTVVIHGCVGERIHDDFLPRQRVQI